MGSFDFVTIFFLVAAVVIFLQLRSVLGRRTGSERPPFDPYSKRESAAETDSPDRGKVVTLPRRDGMDEDESPYAAVDAFAAPGTPLNEQLRAVIRSDPSFNPKEFVNGAQMAYEMIVVAFADGDRKTLKNLLSREVYEGFDATFARLGVDFHKLYFESQTYLLGKDLIDKGLNDGVFYRKPDGSVWIDLTEAGLDHKAVLRSDGTSLYITQDIGTAHKRYEEYGFDKLVYVVAVEQDYHFQVLFETLKRLGEPYAPGLYHLSYGMVELPEGKMKSREGTVVDADDLIAEVIAEARANAKERGEVADLPAEQQEDVIRKVGLAALKFHIIKVQPKKWMTFDPKESVDMQGQTGPYVQYAYVRITGLVQRAKREGIDLSPAGAYLDFQPAERELLQTLYQSPETIAQAAAEYDPSTVANYCYALAKSYNKLWHELQVFNAEDPKAKAFRLVLSRATGNVLKFGMELLGIEMPHKM